MGARRTHRAAVSPATAGGRELSGLVIDRDAPIVVCHSEKEQAVPTVKETFEYHPMLASCNNTDAFLVAVLRRGNAGSNTAADHVAVIDAALAELRNAHRHGMPILVRTDTAGSTREFLAPSAAAATMVARTRASSRTRRTRCPAAAAVSAPRGRWCG